MANRNHIVEKVQKVRRLDDERPNRAHNLAKKFEVDFDELK